MELEMSEFTTVYAIMLTAASIISFIGVVFNIGILMVIIPLAVVILTGIVFLGAFLGFSISEFRYHRKCDDIEYEAYIVQKARQQLEEERWIKNDKTN